jgi:branched-chain amino acid transport system ATP-binding protein
MTAACLQISHLNVHYGDLPALQDACLEIPQGGIVAVIGANGAGKSTLLKTIAGAMTPTRGRILHDGQDINGLKPFQTLARGIAMVPEGRRIFPRLSVEENLMVGGYLPKARPNRRRAMEKVFGLFPILAERRAQAGTNLSGGEQQMLAIGRALMSGPDIVLFDEISLGLAPTAIRSIYTALAEINKLGVTMVLVEQDVQRSLTSAHYAYVLRKGRVVLQGRPADLTPEAVKLAYFGD